MARGEQLGRQWKIIRTLIAARTGKSVRDMAQELDCHPRTVYRDLEALQAAGFPIYSKRKHNAATWYLLESARQQTPIPFTLTELMALYFSRDMLKVLKNTLFFDSIESLFQKIKSTLSADTIRFLKQIEKTLHVGITPHKNYGKIKEIIHTANDAVLNRRCLRITYYSMRRKKESRRVIAPYKLWFFDGTFYLLAHCRLRNDIRMFAADRIKKIDILNSTFEIPPESDIESVLQSSFGAFIGAAIPVVIQFSADVAEYIQEKIWHQSQSIEPQQDGSIIFEATVAGIEEIKHWILGWGAGATVLAPDTLKKEIAAEAAALLQNYAQTE
ncbi:MAG: transcriptional regulator [Deltaproteobacteria bacterium]|jgi:predicted DNA-binding transcriptional regulator YafY